MTETIRAQVTCDECGVEIPITGTHTLYMGDRIVYDRKSIFVEVYLRGRAVSQGQRGEFCSIDCAEKAFNKWMSSAKENLKKKPSRFESIFGRKKEK